MEFARRLHEQVASLIVRSPCKARTSHWYFDTRRGDGGIRPALSPRDLLMPLLLIAIIATGEDISTRAVMEYFKPLMSWLAEQNKGRHIGWE